MYEIVTPGVLASLAIEFIKRIYRGIIKDAMYDFPPIFYQLLVPLITFVCAYLLGLLGMSEPVGLDGRTFISWIVSIVVSFASYEFGIKPINGYAQYMREVKAYEQKELSVKPDVE